MESVAGVGEAAQLRQGARQRDVHAVVPRVVRELLREHGPHLPAEDIGATVYVLEKT